MWHINEAERRDWENGRLGAEGSMRRDILITINGQEFRAGTREHVFQTYETLVWNASRTVKDVAGAYKFLAHIGSTMFDLEKRWDREMGLRWREFCFGDTRTHSLKNPTISGRIEIQTDHMSRPSIATISPEDSFVNDLFCAFAAGHNPAKALEYLVLIAPALYSDGLYYGEEFSSNSPPLQGPDLHVWKSYFGEPVRG